MPAVVPTVDGSLRRSLPVAVVGSLVVGALVMAIIVAATGRPGWWGGYAAASIVAVVGAIASLIVLFRGSDRGVDEAVTLAMAATFVRMAVSLAGLLIAINAFGSAAEPTGWMICGYYGLTLIAETTVLSRAAGGRADSVSGQATGSHK